MKVLDPGHVYELDSYAGEGKDKISHNTVTIIFVKREGENFPGNEGHFDGPNSQEYLRALIDRTKYVDNQKPHFCNRIIIDSLRRALAAYEIRADEIAGRPPLVSYKDVELQRTCRTCGHINCDGRH